MLALSLVPRLDRRRGQSRSRINHAQMRMTSLTLPDRVPSSGDAPMLRMARLAVLAKPGAQDPDRTLAGGLNLEVRITMSSLHG